MHKSLMTLLLHLRVEEFGEMHLRDCRRLIERLERFPIFGRLQMRLDQRGYFHHRCSTHPLFFDIRIRTDIQYRVVLAIHSLNLCRAVLSGTLEKHGTIADP